MGYNRSISLNNFITNRDLYEPLIFFGAGETMNVAFSFFYKNQLELPISVCDNDKKKYNTFVEGVIPIMSFEDVLQTYENSYIYITSDIYTDDILNQIKDEIPSEKIIYFTGIEMEKYKNNNIGLCSTKIPKHTLKVLDKLKYYHELYNKGENIKIKTDDYFIKSKELYVNLIDYMNQIKCEHKTNMLDGIYKVTDDREYISFHRYNKVSNISNERYIQQSIENVIKFNEYLSKKDINFAYIQLPSKVAPNDGKLPYGFSNDDNKQASLLINKLKEHNISVLDIREHMIDQKIDFKDWFYKTDNHWKTIAAFHTNKIVCEHIASFTNTTLNYSYFDIEKYKITTYEKLFLGGESDIAGMLFSGYIDDFQLITPNFETDVSISCEENGYYKRGRSENTLLSYEHLNYGYFKTFPYDVYKLFFRYYTILKNHLLNNKKIFVLNDSFSQPMGMFMLQQFGEIHFFDYRQDDMRYKLFQAIEKEKPDMVIIMCYPFMTLAQYVGFFCFDINPVE